MLKQIPMSQINILVVQSAKHDPMGVLGEYLEAQGAQLHIWMPFQAPAPPEGDYGGLILLGGPMNAHEDDKFPHLQQAVSLIRQFHAEAKPVMGICLGAQLIARAFGSQVYPHSTPELGFSPLTVADPTAKEPWLQDCPKELHLMQWHFDTFDLPPQATLLMTNGVCKHQAYRIGSNIYGFQFHLEVTPEIVLAWLTLKTDWIEANYPHLDQQIKEQLKHHARSSAQFAEKVAQAWIDLISKPVGLTA